MRFPLFILFCPLLALEPLQTEAEIRRFLAPLAEADAYGEGVAKLIGQLGADGFKNREQATQELAALPVLPAELMKPAVVSSDPEVALRSRRLMKDEASRNARLQRAFRRIAEKPILGLVRPLTTLAAYSVGDTAEHWWIAAYVATYREEDSGVYLDGLRNPRIPVRMGSVRALDAENLSAAMIGALMEQEVSSRVRVEMAQALVNREESKGLQALVRLLGDQSFAVRWRAHRMLRLSTGAEFQFRSGDELAAREMAMGRWQAWLNGNGRSAALTLPLDVPESIELFNGVDLNNWVSIDGERIDPLKTGWSVKDGLLRCDGRANGHLRTRERFEAYRLEVTWRWPAGQGGDSGVFLHLGGEDRRSQRRCIEAQLLDGKAGDIWVIGGVPLKVDGQAAGGYVARSGEASEVAPGGWNRMTVNVKDGRVTIDVNGVRQNEVSDCPREASWIGLQSEGDAIEFGRVSLMLE